jgi:phage-related protein
MEPRFEAILLEDVYEFLNRQDRKTSAKILFNIRVASAKTDPKLFKKLTSEIWEFRTKYNKLHHRLLAFWDKTNKDSTLVIATHGFIKKTDKVPKHEIAKAERIMKLYFEQKNN